MRAQIAANLTAVEAVDRLTDGGAVTADDVAELAAFRSWGGLSQVFDSPGQLTAALEGPRERVEQVLGERFDAARRTILNAHYTHPVYAEAMWSTAARFGFTGGRVLEPGCGVGNFLAAAPDSAELVGVELDPTSAAIAGVLHPEATVHSGSFAETRLPRDSFDLVIGNVPFGKARPADRQYNPHGELSLHNYFLVKSLAVTAPGGLVIALTSRYSLDAQNPAGRATMAKLGDFVGAFRLPSGAHRQLAGTDAITDLVIFQRRAPGEAMSSRTEQFLQPLVEVALPRTEDVVPGEEAARERVHPYFVAHPDRVLGELAVGRGLYGEELVVRSPDTTPAAVGVELERRLTDLVDEVAGEHRWAPVRTDVEAAPVMMAPPVDLSEGRVVVTAEGFGQVVDGAVTAVAVPASQHRELTALLGIRDTVVELLRGEAHSADDTAELDQLRARLGQRYDDYTDRFGPLNRFTPVVTSRVNPETGEAVVQRRVPPVMTRFRQDPHAAAVLALESFDEASQRAVKAAIFTERVVVQRTPRRGADTPAEAIALCLDSHGEIRLDTVADLLGIGVDQVPAAAAGHMYLDPANDQWIARAEYLSGNIYQRIDAAEQALAVQQAAGEPASMQTNLDALREVLPTPLEPVDISVRLGAAWIADTDVTAFLRETLDDRQITVVHAGGSRWVVNQGSRYGTAATSTWGTERVPAPDLAERLLCQSSLQVFDEHRDIDGNTVRELNVTETMAAQEKGAQLNEAFAEWVWAEPERAGRLAGQYNRSFNVIALRSYDGQHLTLPGLAATFEPRPHQRAAVARMIAEPAVGLFHEVGAGKTAEMVMGCMELRRLGLASKPAVVVPNHMLEQFTREWLQLYPQAKLLAASSADLSGEKRRRFVARAATGDWDGVILTRGSFARLDVSADTIRRYADLELGLLRQQKERLEGGGVSAKRVEQQIAAAEERLRRRLDTDRDPGITFEESGIDYLCVDELHDYKNLTTASSTPGAAITGSARATDLHMKVEYLRRTHGQRVITGATATPIANSMTEAYVTQRYLRPDLLLDAGLADFDSWAATFGQVTSAFEFTPAGTLKQRTRFAKFVNVPELLRMWHVSADVKTAEDLALPTPSLRAQPDGVRGAEVVLVPRSDQLAAYMGRLGDRSDTVSGVRAEPGGDNILVITTDGRKAALDLRLLSRTEQDWILDTGVGDLVVPGKVTAAADRIAHIWRDTQHRGYVGIDGEPHPTPGALQLVFCDLGTPAGQRPGLTDEEGSRWTVYEALRDELVARGMPSGAVRFIHEAGNDTAKAQLFAACRSGQVAVLIGSTQKMGVGTNIQDRAVALHHLDCPWRPADIAQRDGRIVRQGNQNAEVEVIRYVTEQSFDAALWSTIARKAGFIGQVMRGRLDVREIDDIGDVALDASQVAAVVSGDDRLIVRAQLDSDVNRYQRLARAHDRNHQTLRSRLTLIEHQIPHLQQVSAQARQLATGSSPTAGDRFSAVIDGRHVRERPAAQQLLLHVLRGPANPPIQVGGVPFELTRLATPTSPGVGVQPGQQIVARYTPAGLGDHGPHAEITAATLEGDLAGVVRRLENIAGGLDQVADQADSRGEQLAGEHARAAAQLAKPFAHADRLTEAVAQLDQLDRELSGDTTDIDSPETEPSDDDTGVRDATLGGAFPHPSQTDLMTSSRSTMGTGRPVAPATMATLKGSTNHER